MNLVVDIGNTSVKVAVFQDAELLEKTSFSLKDFSEKISEIKKKYPQTGAAILSSVVKDVKNEVNLLQKGLYFLQLSPDLALPFRNCYATPLTLGKDRIALAAAAVAAFPQKNVLVIDAGTCITYDFKNAKEEYLGGSISPGLEMRFKALHKFTANLPLLTTEEDVKLIGDSTKSSILSGVVNGMLDEIDGTINAYRSKYEDLTVIFTGGDEQFLSMRLKNGIFANSNFLLEGLNYILEFNRTQ
ncbi:type III pantothenate kinase [Zunongwangia sp. F363]|uniref:Type III pantothenate kinase n=1 Tax=Autumnicola tepida TaxID=3075595 RepID=A0ABU3CBH1_9FLAO|nr:type III pantothenate kinase [Zunongwangia sp. F363]MDT0643679.1 type III pantothenate kinase [Zunongwangia sp. F363]